MASITNTQVFSTIVIFATLDSWKIWLPMICLKSVALCPQMVSMSPTWSERRFLPLLLGASAGFIHSATRPPAWLLEAGELSAAPAPCSVRPLHQDENLRIE